MFIHRSKFSRMTRGARNRRSLQEKETEPAEKPTESSEIDTNGDEVNDDDKHKTVNNGESAETTDPVINEKEGVDDIEPATEFNADATIPATDGDANKIEAATEAGTDGDVDGAVDGDVDGGVDGGVDGDVEGDIDEENLTKEVSADINEDSTEENDIESYEMTSEQLNETPDAVDTAKDEQGTEVKQSSEDEVLSMQANQSELPSASDDTSTTEQAKMDSTESCEDVAAEAEQPLMDPVGSCLDQDEEQPLDFETGLVEIKDFQMNELQCEEETPDSKPILDPVEKKLVKFMEDPTLEKIEFHKDISDHERFMVHKFVTENGLRCESTGNNLNHSFVVYKDGVGEGDMDGNEHETDEDEVKLSFIFF